ncbi:hypothetical protein BBJ28_00027125 [Nothophytophthora sp. Chile5]|nr:hypothetical protein BBJ28_00027125 [Nothophytophthora sp. Chile5]
MAFDNQQEARMGAGSSSEEASGTWFYAVAVGRRTGVYTVWPDAAAQVCGYPGFKLKTFRDFSEALAFVKENQLEGQEEEHEVTFGETEAGTDPDPEHPESLVTFCDGSVLGFGQPFCNGGAAYACIFPHRREWDEVASVAGSEVTNTHVEYLAAVAAMERANYEDPSGEDVLFIFSDSLVLIDCMTSWVSKWQTNGWRTAKGRAVKNRETIERLVNAQGGRRVLWRHVKAHTAAEDWASHWNSVADTEARGTAGTNASCL